MITTATISKLAIVAFFGVAALSAPPANAGETQISQQGASSICGDHGGTQSGSWGSGCGFCGPNNCTQVTCKDGKCSVDIEKVTEVGNTQAPKNGWRPINVGVTKQEPTSGAKLNAGGTQPASGTKPVAGGTQPTPGGTTTIYSRTNAGSQQNVGEHGAGNEGGHK